MEQRQKVEEVTCMVISKTFLRQRHLTRELYSEKRPELCMEQGDEYSSLEFNKHSTMGQRVNISCFEDDLFSVTTIQLCSWNMKVATDNT